MNALDVTVAFEQKISLLTMQNSEMQVPAAPGKTASYLHKIKTSKTECN
jgi:hypothetical protein